MRIDVTPQQFKDLVQLGIPLIACVNSYFTIKSKVKKALAEMDEQNMVVPREIQSFLKSHAIIESVWLFIVTSVYLFFVLPKATDLMGVWMIMMSALFLMMVAKIILNIIGQSGYDKRWNEIQRRNPIQADELQLCKESLTARMKARV